MFSQGSHKKNTFFALISPDTNTLHPQFFQSLYNFTTSLPPVLWDFHFFKTNPTAHATLNGSDEEKKFLKSSKGSPTYLRVVEDVFVFFSTALFSGDVEKLFFFPKRKLFQHTGKKRRKCSEQNLEIFRIKIPDPHQQSLDVRTSVFYQSSWVPTFSLSLSFWNLDLLVIKRSNSISTHGR